MKKIKALLVVVCTGVLLTACGNPSQKGVEYLEDGKYDQAIEQFEQAVDKKKNVGDAYRGIGIAKWEKKDYKGARKAFKKALENDAEKTGTIYNMIGNCDLKLGKAKEALNYYNLGLAQEDSGKKMKKEMQYNIIVAYEQMEDWESAKVKLEEYLENYPNDKSAKKEAEQKRNDILKKADKKIKEKVMKRKKWEMPGVKAGSRRAAAVTLTVLLVAVCGGCGNQYSVEDAVSRDEKFTLVGDAGEAQTKDLSQATTTAMIAHEEPTAYQFNGKKVNVTEVGMGETKLYGGFEITVLNAWKLGNTLTRLDEIENGDATFKNWLVISRELNEDGSSSKNNHQYVAVKVRMKNVSGGNNKKLEMSGTLVNKDGENLFQRISFAEIIGFDKCPYLKRPEELHKDAYFYNFAQDEEIETVMVYQLINTPGVLRDVYMYSGIGGIGGTDGVNSIADGSYMFRLDIGEGN